MLVKKDGKVIKECAVGAPLCGIRGHTIELDYNDIMRLSRMPAKLIKQHFDNMVYRVSPKQTKGE